MRTSCSPDPREHPALWELDGALLALVDRMLLELDPAAHAQLWTERRREMLARRRATDMLDRMRPRRRRSAEPGTADAGDGPGPDGPPDGALGPRRPRADTP
jgi:hypothetical protein